MAMTFKKRLLAVLLCLVFILCVVVQPVFANPVIPVASVAIPVIVTLMVAAGIVFPSSSDAQNAANAFISEINNGTASLSELQLKLNAMCLAYVADGIQGLRDVCSVENLQGFLSAFSQLGFKESSTEQTLDLSDKTSSLLDFGDYSGAFDPWAACGGNWVWYTTTAWGAVIVGTPYFSGTGRDKKAIVPLYKLDNYLADGSFVSSGFYSVNIGYFSSYSWGDMNSTASSDGIIFAITYTDLSTGKTGSLSYSFQGSPGPKGPKFSSLAWIAALLSAIRYSFPPAARQKLAAAPPSSAVPFTRVLTPEEAATKTYEDVVQWESDDTSSDPTSSGGSSLPVGDPITIGGLQTLFIPAPDYLSRKFGTMLTDFPDLGDLEELRRLTTLGERKPEFPLELNNYFGITTRQDGIDVDVWDDKRDVFKPWIKGFIIILTIIYNFNMVYKLVRGGIFSDAGSGARGGAGVKKEGEG